jgi:hypothetical protein
MQTPLNLKSEMALIEEIQQKFKMSYHQADNAAQWLTGNGELGGVVEGLLYDFYIDSGEMPYGVAKARTGDPKEWIYQQLKGLFNL